ncbi:LysR family transcriptional regulator [Paenibacillus mucilaginosus]|uniref:Transcriptional regulator n=3 Tax=Paenibacillus mucilaginosus TaxID=61624 RepID=H6NKH8_9BACL|nr:LysR family transcriptional regulator [Paenibacillus mucilaginosus]AEI44574.1 transcriptional regulator [Paenibacillus mucilaginosus KNP414]AFC32369.1 transcriptional regulator [Paenibacillus mucilaginosus 3016]AFH64677.1 LysR family transcriptional regulator [Paenibacillus mucilaginosus K02]MCG7215517.1 LysR substrate-binding domain-containing protein [Paenibacillus mucilaginosus]WDM26149.1 LysR family transcriptional regulator [Paenibacillus mucilaginosus]
MINFELYKVFYLTARSGSLSKAAKELYITQPSVSHSIKLLEEGLGLQLFARTSRGVELTKEGGVLYTYIEQAFNFISLAEQKMEELRSNTSGEIQIGGSDSLCKHYLLPFLESFHREFPGIGINLVHGTTPEIVRSLKEGKIDIGIVRLPVTDEQLHVREGITIRDCFVAGPKYRELAERDVSLEELLNYPIILFSRNSSSRRFITKQFLEQGLVLEPEIELGSVDLLIEFAKIGFGVSFVTREFVAKELEEESLFEVKLKAPLPSTRVGIITLKSVPLSAAAAEFIKKLEGGSGAEGAAANPA